MNSRRHSERRLDTAVAAFAPQFSSESNPAAFFTSTVPNPRLVLGEPDADQVAGDVVTLGEAVQGLPCKVLLGDLTLERDAV
jgi:hypothetical protein